MSKRKRTDSSSKSIEHYFKKSTSTTVTLHQPDSFQSDLEHAIKQSLADRSPPTKDAHSACHESDPKSPSEDSPLTCPICGTALDSMPDMNGHINKCLDNDEHTPEIKHELDSVVKRPSSPTQKDPTLTTTHLSSDDPEERKEQSHSDSSRPKRKCPFYKWIQGLI